MWTDRERRGSERVEGELGLIKLGKGQCVIVLIKEREGTRVSSQGCSESIGDRRQERERGRVEV